jgi:hypothetical protein
VRGKLGGFEKAGLLGERFHLGFSLFLENNHLCFIRGILLVSLLCSFLSGLKGFFC